ncbi:MAG: dihydropyrimidinase [Thermoleophilaceae bacterium]|nr:dihydropyrimidinase [Thermoleophilaceae bacterium]
MKKLVRGGTVVTATEMFDADVLVEDEQIAWVGRSEDAEADEVIDASGCFVLPGLIDNHTHLSMPFGGTVTADDFDTGTAAAAAGGTTCIVDFALQTDGSLLKGLETWKANAEGRAHVDYAFHLAVSEASPEAIREIPRAVEEGVSTFKLFMAYKGALMVDDLEMLNVFEAMAETGALPMVHAENGDAIVFLQERAAAAGELAPRFHATTRPPEVEAEATSRAIRLATWAGSPLFVVHVSCEPAVAEIQRARDAGLPIYGETCIQYLALTVEDLAREGFEGAKFVCSPPLREAYNHDVLWSALRQQALQIVSTDHCPFNYETQKSLGRDDFRLIPNGLPTIESRLAVMYEYGVRGGKITMPELVRMVSTAPAQLFGLAPSKGAIAAGADADLVVFDPSVETTISAATHKMNVDYNPFEGHAVHGEPRVVLARGDVVFRDGDVVSSPGRGRYVARDCVSLGS